MKKILTVLLLALAMLVIADGPHPMYIEIRNSQNEIPAAGDITFEAWLLSNPNDILDENTTDCYYPAFSSYVKVNCGQFSTWNDEDILHLEVTEISSGEQGTGEYELTYDASQFFDMENGGIYLGGGGGPPEIELPGEFVTDEDIEFTEDFSQYISGIYTQLTASGSTNIIVSIIGSSVTFSPAENWFGSEELSFEVTGIGGETASDAVLVVVNPVNDPPDLNLPQQFQFNEDGSFEQDISGYASDVEGDELSFSALGSEHITAEMTGTLLQMTAEPDWNGIEYISIMVSDDQRRETTTGEVMVIVNPVNDAPVIELPEQVTFRAGEPAILDFWEFVQDIDGDDLDISFYGEDDLEIEVDGYEVSFLYETGWHGSDEIIFIVSDNVLRATDSDTMTVNIFYPEDTILNCGEYEIDDGDDLTVTVTTTEFFEEWSQVSIQLDFSFDPTVLSYTGYDLTGTLLSNGQLNVEEIEAGQLEISYMHYLPIAGAGDLFRLEFETVCWGGTVLDLDNCLIPAGELDNLFDGYVTVNDIGLEHPPVADAGVNFGVLSGEEGTLDGSSSYDPDGDAITFLWDAPPDLVLADETAAITDFTAPIVQDDTEYVVTLTVSDGTYNTSDFVVVTVSFMNHPPNIDLPEEFSFEEDEELEIDFEQYVNDEDGDVLTMSAEGQENIIVEIDELIVTFSAPDNWFGSEVITFTVDDGFAAYRPLWDEVTVMVNPVNDPPHADAGMDINGRDGEVITLDGSGSWDVETEELEYLWIAPAGVMLNDPYSSTPSFTAPQVVDPTEYDFTLQVNDGDMTDEDVVTVTIQDDEPVLLNVELLPDNNAQFTWFAPGSGGSGQELEQGFEGVVPPQGWLNVDNDGDGYGWYIYIQNPHSGSSSLASQSFMPGTGALTPDNWFISPPIQVGALSVLNFWIGAQDLYYPQEHYSVLVSTQGTALENFTNVLIEETLSDADWHEKTFSLQNWAGSIINIAWRHHDVTDQFLIKLDDVQIINSASREIEYSEDFEVELADWDICQHSFRNRDLLGYNVFLDGEEQEFVEIREYTFLNVVGEHEAGVQAVYDNGVSEIVTIDFDHTANDGQLPLVTALRRVYPNPFNPETRIEFSLEQNVQVTVEVFNIKGQKVADLIDETLPAGNHDLTWQAQNLPTGVYFLKIKAGEYMKMEKLLLLK